MDSGDLERVVCVGTTGSGKSTFARRLAQRHGCKYIELDALHWLPDWQERDSQELRELVRKQVAAERWVLDGNYEKLRDVAWARATAVVWLNYSFATTLRRMTFRTFRRWFRAEELWSGNTETLAKFFFSRDSLLLWFFKSFWKNRRRYRAVFDGEEFPGLAKIEFRRPRDAERWLSAQGDGLA